MKYYVYVVVCSVPGLPPFYVGYCRDYRYEKENYHGSITSKRWQKKWFDALSQTPELFKRKVIRKFDTRKEANDFETEFLRHFEANRSSLFVNMSINTANYKGRDISGKKNPFFGKAHSEETKARWKGVARGSTRKGRANTPCYKTARVISPSGEIFEVDGLGPFAVKHGLRPNNFIMMVNGHQSHHKGWKLA